MEPTMNPEESGNALEVYRIRETTAHSDRTHPFPVHPPLKVGMGFNMFDPFCSKPNVI